MAIDVSFRDTYSSSAKDLSRLAKNFLINEGVVKTGLAVSQSDVPAMSVKVATGSAYFYGAGANSNVMYEFESDSVETINIPIAGVQARIDIICLKVNSASQEAGIVSIQGTPSGSPVVPTTPASHYKLAEVAIGGSVTQITNANITDKRNITSFALDSYPIGSIFINTVNTNPTNYFGGAWTAFGSGRTLVGVDTGQTEFDNVEETGGAKTHAHIIEGHNHTIVGHTHTVPTIEHSHTVTTSDHSHIVNGNTGVAQGGGAPFGSGALGPDGNHTHNVNITSGLAGGETIGSSNALGANVTSESSGTLTTDTVAQTTAFVSSLQPYITVYFWKRTA